MDQVQLSEAISKNELHSRLRSWVTADEAIIGPPNVDERTAWVHVQDEGNRYKFHADPKRAAVVAYLKLVDRYGDGIQWQVVPNRRGRQNAVAFGPDAEQVEPALYLYLVEQSG